jgi:hypothetical protein
VKGDVEWKTELVARTESGLPPAAAAATRPAMPEASSSVEEGSSVASA